MAGSKRPNERPEDYHLDPGETLPCAPSEPLVLEPWSGPTAVVGTSRPRIDAYERVSGAACYTADVLLPDMLHAAILRCPHPHARVRRIDATRAAGMPGVRGVLTAESPGADIPWFGRGAGAQSRLFDARCRYPGEEVAAVAAETEAQAREALGAIQVDYEVLPFVLDPEQALAEGAPKLHDGGNADGEPVLWERGDLARGFAEADYVLERSFRVGTHVHVPIESFGSVARWSGRSLDVWDSTQGVYRVMADLAEALGLSSSRVRVRCPWVGGGFGAKLVTGKYTVIAALLARAAGRPVRLFLDREESLECAGVRPGARMTLKGGVKKDGTLTALQLTNVSTGGAYAGGRHVVGAQVLDLYLCPNVRVEERWAFTNTSPVRPMRAPGFPQCSFALEQMMDMLAEALGMDPVALRLQNVPTFSQFDEKRRPYTSTGLRECLERGAQAFGWKEARGRPRGGALSRGVGMAACNWWSGSGNPPSTATLRLFADGGVTVSTGASDLGTGTKTAAAMVAAEELGIDPEGIQVIHADTATTPFHYSSGGSNTLPGAIPAVRAAAHQVREELRGMACAELGVDAGDLEVAEGAFRSRSDPGRTKTFGELLRARNLRDVVGVGHRAANPEDKVVRPFGAQFAEVEVNRATGEVRVLRLLGAHDSGRVINRTTFDNQVHGGMVQGLGFGMTEDRVLDRRTGTLLSRGLHDYKVPTALDVPADLEAMAVDPADRECNNLGVKGLGEPPVIPTAAAIANAVHHAVGVRVTDAPIDPPRVLELLARGRAREVKP